MRSEKQLQAQQSNVMRLEGEVQSVTTLYNQAHRDNQRLSDENSQLQKRIKDLENERESLKAENKRLMAMVEELTRKCEVLQRTVDDHGHELKKLHATVHELVPSAERLLLGQMVDCFSYRVIEAVAKATGIPVVDWCKKNNLSRRRPRIQAVYKVVEHDAKLLMVFCQAIASTHVPCAQNNVSQVVNDLDILFGDIKSERVDDGHPTVKPDGTPVTLDYLNQILAENNVAYEDFELNLCRGIVEALGRSAVQSKSEVLFPLP